MQIEPYHVTAYNTAKASENKIHDDANRPALSASKGGFVGGVNGLRLHVPPSGAALGPRMAGTR